MGIQHLLLLLIYLDPLCGLNANKRSKGPPRKSGKVKEVNGTAAPSVIKSTTGTSPGTALPRRITQLSAPTLAGDHDTCLGYYDVSGQYDKEFACNNTDHRYCCGSCFLRFCCPIRAKRLEQRACTNYNTPDWIKTQPPSPAPTGEVYDPALDRTNTTVYIACGVVALIVLLGISAKVAYDKATRPPQEMNVHRALADILRQQGPVPISQYEQENMATVEGSPKESSLKNHYTPIHNKTNHGYHGKDNFRSGQDMHNFISSGFVTLGRGHLKAQHSVDDLGGLSWQGELDVPLSYNSHQHDYTSHLDLTGSHTPKIEKPRMNNILTSQTEPYDLSFSRSFQNLTHLPPSYEMAVKADLSDKDFDDFYSRKQQLLSPDPPPRVLGLQSHLLKLSVDSPPSVPHRSQQKQRRVQRAMSQDHVLSPPMPRTPRKHVLQSATSYAPPASPYHARILSQEQLLSADRLQSQDPLLSPDKMLSLRRSNFREKAMSRALSHTDMFMPTTPVMDRHYKMTKMHSHPSSSKNDAEDISYNTKTLLSVSGAQTANRRQAFASRRTHTVDHLQYIPGHQHHQYRTASKTEVTV
ncbi:protein shisa-6-like isoform X2 [Pygocentrus nattereri]|uniref:Shisa N-terminal domain-containing protein n=1 Tax=Pygocentrus nattereri TaxID=42514 RepID=A0AAR2LHZ2_PYGNA|nr:protein shisa-6-like isoform X2 [Pygocentrus nattereri]